MLIFNVGLYFEHGSEVAFTYYMAISVFSLLAFYNNNKTFRVIFFTIFIVGILLGTEIFGLTMEQIEEFYILLPVVNVLIFPGLWVTNIISIILAFTYFLHPGDEQMSSVIEDALELFIISGLVTVVSFQFKKLSSQMNNYKHDSYYHLVTNLPNRSAIIKFTENYRSDKTHTHKPYQLIMFEISNIREITSRLGTLSSEQVLRMVADNLSFDETDNIQLFYIGLGEFALIAFNEEIHRSDYYINEIISFFSKTYEVDGYMLKLKLSAGSVSYPTDGVKFDELYYKSTLALLASQDEVNINHVKYEPSMQRKDKETFTLIQELQQAVKQDEFIIHYQPKNSLTDNSLVGFEALVRWMHPEKGLLYPGSFIELAEKTGIIKDIGELVIQKVFRFQQKWANANRQPVKISINLSAIQLEDINLTNKIEAYIQQYKINPEFIEFEVTEGTLIIDPEKSIHILNEIKKTGISLSLDDFGVGYSSFTYIKQFPIDILKLDRFFVKDLHEDPKNQKIIKTIIDLGHNLDLQVLAEGVETDFQLNVLKNLGCDSYQGYFESKPLSEEAIIEYFDHLS
jgi:EAL domain-containing protein (putative c-di-GMP-specific phosphodiesterase class I)/GGDEF domain-containing protein